MLNENIKTIRKSKGLSQDKPYEMPYILRL